MSTYTIATGSAGTLELIVNLASQNIAANTSTVNWELHLLCYTGATYDLYSQAWSVNILGVGYSGSYTFDFRSYTDKLIASGSTTVGANADGTPPNTAVSGSMAATGTNVGGPTTVSGTFVPPTIPRATQPTVSPTSGYTDSSYTIGIVPASSTFTHDLYRSLDGGASYGGPIQTGLTGNATYVPPSTDYPNSTSNTIILLLRTYSGTTAVGDKTVSLPVTVPSSVVPTVSSVAWVDTQTSAPNMPTLMGGAGRYVQGWSILEPTITALGASGSTVTSSSATVNGQTAASGSAFASAVGLSGSVPFTATAADTRGRSSATYSGTVPVTAYSFPNLPTPVVTRTSDAAGLVPSSTGTYLAITPSASVSNLTFGGTQYNTLEWQVRIAPVGGSYTVVQAWTSATVSGVTWTTKYVAAGPYASNTAWQVEVSVRDIFGHNGYNTGSTVAVLTVTVPTEAVAFDWDGANGIGIGKYRSQGMVDVFGSIFHRNGNVLGETQLAATDWNNAMLTGDYYGQNLANAPDGILDWFWVHSAELGSGSLYVEQIASRVFDGGIGRMWKRVCLGGTWEPWYEVGGVPVGTVSQYAGGSAPAGYLTCDGSGVSRTTYARLFAVLGSTYGPGDGSTTFNLPDLRGRVPVGYDSRDANFNAIGKTGGEETHTLTVAEMPSHNHGPLRIGGNTAVYLQNVASGAGEYGINTNAGSGIDVPPTGGGAAHNNLQPYIALNYIIKY